MIKLSHFLSPQNIFFLNSKSREDALLTMTRYLQKSGAITDSHEFLQAILAREKIVSTGIGMGVALPHAKLSFLKEFFIAVGIQQGKGLEWDSLDSSSVRLIFMIGGPETEQNIYLKILSRLTFAIKDGQFKKALLLETSSQSAYERFLAFEKTILKKA